MTNASASGRHRRRRGRFLPPGGGCTTPAAWIALRLSARPAASVSSDPAGNGPCLAIA